MEKMEHAGVHRDTITYSSVITACAKAGELDKALSTFQEMNKCDVDQDDITYISLYSFLFFIFWRRVRLVS